MEGVAAAVAVRPVVLLEGVSKIIRGRTILEDVSFEILPAQIIGLSGLNGSGKSTLLKIIGGFITPTEGRVVVFGKEIGREAEFPDRTGVLIEKPGFLTSMSGRKNLELLASIRNEIGEQEIREVLTLVGLDPDNKRPVRTYSTGMIQRLGIAQALMERPELLLLDEPTSNLDREGITIVHTVLRDLKKKGITILMTSPDMEELRHICDTVFWVENGHLSKEPPQLQ